MISIIDYKAGNPNSVKNMLKRLGWKDVFITSEPQEIDNCDKIVLPGVGSFDYCITQLENLHLIESLNQNVLIDKKPILGICMGMQLMSNKSEEGEKSGLGWINGNVIQFKAKRGLPVPHMGWNTIEKGVNKKFRELNFVDGKYYFAHSYYFQCEDLNNIVAYTKYGEKFASIINKDNIYGVQFHPEKSHKWGLELFKSFIDD